MPLDANKAKALIRAKLRPALETVGAAVEQQMKARCPVETGRLRDSLRHEVVDLGGDAIELRGTAGVDYWVFQDRGTSAVPPTHFASAPVHELKHDFVRRVKGNN